MSADQLPMPEAVHAAMLRVPTVARLYYTGSPARRYKRASTQDGHGEPLVHRSHLERELRRLYAELHSRNAALEEAAKLRKLIADHNDECVRMCDSRFANGPTQCPMRAYNRQCTDCPKDGMVEVPALKKENGDASQ